MPNSSPPYGLRPSPITPHYVAHGLRLSSPAWDSDGETLLWLEGHSNQNVLVAQRGSDAPCDLTNELSPRAGLHYGGGDFTVHNGVLVFVANGRLYRQLLAGGSAQPITPAYGTAAAPAISPDGQWVVYLHSYEGRDALAIVATEGQTWPQILFQGHDFYMQPVWRPDGRQIAVVAWNFPNMPWDGTELHLLNLAISKNGQPYLVAAQKVAGNAETAIFQPEYSPSGEQLAYVSDTSGWGQLYLLDLMAGTHRQLFSDPADYIRPGWVQGLRNYAWLPNGSGILTIRNRAAIHTLVQYDLATETLTDLDNGDPDAPYTELLQPIIAPDGRLALLVSNGQTPQRLVIRHPNGTWQTVRRTLAEYLPAATFSQPESLTWPIEDGSHIHALYFAPTGPTRPNELPPCIINIHGGPTSQRLIAFNISAQYWATRGYAYLELNYRGSTGYGRDYMLKGRQGWGLVDVEDAVSAAKHLAETQRADPQRTVIMGGSSGGTTVLLALCNHPGVFRAGVNLYGVSNMFNLADDTHKFESRYTDQVIGRLPEDAEIYRQRSAINFVEKIKDPIITFQGADDKVVTPDQSETIVASLRRRNVPHEYHLYAGEGHGWRKTETILHFYTTLEAFLRTYVLYA